MKKVLLLMLFISSAFAADVPNILDKTTPTIVGGSINSTPIGATTASTGAFTTLTASGLTTPTAGITVTGGAITLSPAGFNDVLSPTGAGTVTINPATAGTINNVSIGITTPLAAKFTTLTETNLLISNTAPAIASGFGGTPSIVSNNGTATFQVNIGTGGVASSGVITMPTAAAGWNCIVTPAAAPQAAAVTYSGATSATSITLTNYTLTTGMALAWTASFVLAVNCMAF